MKRSTMLNGIAGATVAAILFSSSPARSQTPRSTIVTFDKDKPGQAPANFSFGRTGSGAAGKWIVQAERDAPSTPHVLAQVDADETDYRFPVAVADEPAMKNGKASVRCEPVSGQVDEACGLVFRYLDENNYYLTRANALEDNTRLYVVKDGKRKQIASHSGKVARGTWHAIAADADGDHIQVFFDGKKIIDAHDKTFSGAGKVGVWTKADSVTYFDDLTVTPR